METGVSLRGIVQAGVAVLLATLTACLPAFADKMAPSTPEHVTEALAELQLGKTARARIALREAIGDQREPADARDHAKEALDQLKNGNVKKAKMHATNGAAVEHLTYALRALNTGRLTGSESATNHLTEAKAISKVRKYATAAIEAIKNHSVADARRDIKAGLKVANKE
jgi:hypothetical protein